VIAVNAMKGASSAGGVLLPVADAGSSSAFVRLINVVKSFRTSAGELTALKGISLEIAQGELTMIVGRSGAGKSTLVNVITGVDRVTSGQVWVNETPVHLLDEDRLALWRGLRVGIVYQSFQLLPMLSLLDNVMLPMDFGGLYSPKKSLERAEQLLAEVGLAEHRHKPPTRISGGQQQRVAIARALANDPPLLVADEPTGNLDSATAEAIMDLFEGLVARGKTIIMVTHDQSLAQRATRAVRIANGQIVG